MIRMIDDDDVRFMIDKLVHIQKEAKELHDCLKYYKGCGGEY